MTVLLSALRPSGDIDPQAIAEAARLLRDGRLVAIPTETVYGLGANALDAVAVRRIFEAKGRPTFNPLIVHVLDVSQAGSLATDWSAVAKRLAEAFWPGPLSIVVPKAGVVPDLVTGGSPSVALRSPSHAVARAVIAAAGVPIAAPSANRSNAVSPTTAQHVLGSLGGRIDAVLDAGPCAVGIESTVIDVTSAPVVLRPGGITIEAIEAVIGPVAHHRAARDDGHRASPGMLSRHYAPDAETMLVPESDIAAAIGSIPSMARIGVLVRHLPRVGDRRVVQWRALGDDPVAFAHDLYATLHDMEEAGATHVILERVPNEPPWVAVTDRLTRAASRADD